MSEFAPQICIEGGQYFFHLYLAFMKRLFILFYTCLFAVLLNAQKDTAFIYTFGGEQDEQGRDIELTADSGFIMVGATSSFGDGNSDIYLVKVDSNIKYQWSRAIGHFHLEFGHAVKQTKDGGYIICGYSNSQGNGSYDGYLVLTDDTGAVVWEKYYGGFDWDKFYDVELTPDGGFMLVGETNSFGAGDADAWIVKTDSLGTIEWEKFIGGKKKDIAHALISTKDGNYAFCGENASKNDTTKGDAWLVKFDGSGKVQFDVTHQKSEYEITNDLCETSDSGLVLIGKTQSYNYPIEDIIEIKYNSEGIFIWEVPHRGVWISANKNDGGKSISEFSDGNLYFNGYSSTFGNGEAGMYISKTDKNGQYISAPSFGALGIEMGYSLIEANGAILSFGTTSSYGFNYTDFYLVKFDTVDLISNYSLVVQENNDVTLNKPLNIENYQNQGKYSIHPNPLTGNVLNINSRGTVNDYSSITLYNAQGAKLPITINNQTIETPVLSKGLYILQIENEIFKIVKE